MEVQESCSRRVIGAAIEVHKLLGPGLLESAYQACLARELAIEGIPFRREVVIPLEYKGAEIDAGFRLDFVVNDELVIETKSVDRLRPIHEAQLLTYLKLSGYRVGLLVNFNQRFLKDGIKRMVL